MRLATMPLTPSCHPSPPNTRQGPPSYSSAARAVTEAAMDASVARRSSLMASRRPASVAASTGSWETSRSNATSTSPMRPAALRRGTSENGRSSASMEERSARLEAASATRPGREVRRMDATPSATRARFSPTSSIMSLTVPRLARSV